jgi:hypothetical protein
VHVGVGVCVYVCARVCICVGVYIHVDMCVYNTDDRFNVFASGQCNRQERLKISKVAKITHVDGTRNA